MVGLIDIWGFYTQECICKKTDAWKLVIKMFNNLISEKFQCFGRTLDMIELGFGELSEKTDRRGKKYTISNFVLYTQKRQGP